MHASTWVDRARNSGDNHRYRDRTFRRKEQPLLEKKQPVISTQNPQSLLQIESLARISQSLAVLDASLMPEWEYRGFSYNARHITLVI